MSSRRAVTVLSCTLLSFLSVSLGHAGDFRAAWVASVYNLNFPSRPGLPAAEQERQIASIVETAKRAGLNPLMRHFRPEVHARYRSEPHTSSRFLTAFPTL